MSRDKKSTNANKNARKNKKRIKYSHSAKELQAKLAELEAKHEQRRNKSTSGTFVFLEPDGSDENYSRREIPQQPNINPANIVDDAAVDYEESPILPDEDSENDSNSELIDQYETQINELQRQLQEARTMREVHVKSSGIPTVSLKSLSVEAIEEFKDFVLKSKGDLPNFNRNNFITAPMIRRIQRELVASGRIAKEENILERTDDDFFALLEYVKDTHSGARTMSITLDQVAQNLRFIYDHHERTNSMHKFSEEIYSIQKKLALTDHHHNEEEAAPSNKARSDQEISLVKLIIDALKVAPEKETAIAAKVRTYLNTQVKIGKVPKTFDDLINKLYELFMHAIEVHDEAITIYGDTLKGSIPSVPYNKPSTTRKEDTDSVGVDKTNNKAPLCNACGRFHKAKCNFLGGTKDGKTYLPHPDINTEPVPWSDSTKGKAWAAKNQPTLPSRKTLSGVNYDPMPTN